MTRFLPRYLLLSMAIANVLATTSLLPASAEDLEGAEARADAEQRIAPEQRIAQNSLSQISITAVRLQTTETGLQVVLETANGGLVLSTPRVIGNAWVADVSNAAIAQDFSQTDPIDSIALISVTQLSGERVRIAITGVAAPPEVAVITDSAALTISLTPTQEAAATVADDEALQVVATAEADSPYRVPETAVGTRTETPILRIPQSVQVIPQSVVEEQGATTVGETLRNAAGISSGRIATDSQSLVPVIRGFETRNVLRNGLQEPNFSFGGGTSLSNIERVEILRGPSSVLYGRGSLGGTVNLVTEQPLNNPQYRLDYTLGQFDQHRMALDATGPLTGDGAIAYRLNLAYDTAESFRDFEEQESFFIAPVVRLIDTADTQLTLDLEYLNSRSWGAAPELPAVGTVFDSPLGEVGRAVNLGEPSLSQSQTRVTRLGYQLEHRFTDHLALRHELLAAVRDTPESRFIIPSRLESDQRTLTRLLTDNPGDQQTIVVNTQLVSTFATGAIDHELLAGVEFSRESITDLIRFRFLSPIDIFDPVYRPDAASDLALTFGNTATQTNAVGFYLQDQLSLLEDLVFVVGGRFDIVNQTYDDRLNETESFERQEEAFSPRVGVVYQPAENLAFYASYTRSFEPVIGRSRLLDPITNQTIVGEPFEPERGTQYEVGVKADLLDGRLLTTLALYQLERTNVVTQGPDSPLSSVQVGAQRSRGVELTVAGQLLPGWNIIASYAYTDAEVAEDNQFGIGNRLPNVPDHAASLWTTYEIQRGDWRGLGFGLGLFFQGERSGDLNNTFDLPGYLRTDVALFYRRGDVQVGLTIQNLFDTEYYEGARSDVRVIPGEPLTVSGNIRWEF